MTATVTTPAATATGNANWRRFRRNPGGMVGLVLLTALVVLALIGPVLTGDPTAQNLGIRLQAPSGAHPLGTDQLGRDVLARVLSGARISLGLGVSVMLASLIVGSAVGLLAGLRGGWWDEVIMRITDIFLAFPSLILAMAISAALGPSLTNVMIAVALVSWPTYARLIRAQVLALREREFVEAARALGADQGRIAGRHLLPNAVAPLLVQGSFDVGSAILTAAGLGFIGFGAQPPTPEWGAMVSETRNYIGPAPWASSTPAVAILLTVLAFNLLGDGLRDVFDPRAAR
ncbi:peptide/nickel transport system permease protein [Deinococcus metalli]|uniref:Diguanylate cyclase n=1 Tax=Deinococcus metalli TaxID=1141878 RepID=A0A7W8KHN5_9DEIO|nr:nickel transporter permease [Deinococcus metalli]MBB5378357.1 peptide/nickel transport system permease protein [Deinococcus metalli]GHF59480.1 diguanylate cyclase [Deinococcus metalli]